jgi:tRNA (guanine-N7-)-methyltransferase
MTAPAPLLVRPGLELTGPGDWPRVFGRRAPLEVEVGFGRDDGLLRRAAAQPERDFLGIELKDERVETYVRRAGRLGLRNLRIVPGRAETVIGVLLPDACADAVRVLFPDPWPKARHAGHRLLRPFFVRELRRVLRPGGELVLATDDAPYAAEMVESVAVTGGLEGPLDGPADRPGEEDVLHGTTLFERKWRAEGRTIRYFRYRRAS